MSVAATPRGYLERPRPSGLADVIDVILDKGLVVDAYVRVSLIGIEILTIDARIVVASVDTYLRFAEAVNRLDIASDDRSEGLPQLMESITSGGAKSKTKGAIEGVKEKLTPDGSALGTAAKGAVAAAAIGAAAAAAREIASRMGSDENGGGDE
jgi:gas vesicle structural protein